MSPRHSLRLLTLKRRLSQTSALNTDRGRKPKARSDLSLETTQDRLLKVGRGRARAAALTPEKMQEGTDPARNNHEAMTARYIDPNLKKTTLKIRLSMICSFTFIETGDGKKGVEFSFNCIFFNVCYANSEIF